MAETTSRRRSQVTITLGRSGQVVKRVLDSGSSEQPTPAAVAFGSKRSVRDRLGGATLELHNNNNNKRLRGDNGRLNSNSNNCCIDDVHLSKDDLRFKIIKRTQSNRQQQNMMDLRDMLSRSARPSTASPIPSYETRHGRERVPEPRPERESMPVERPRGPLSRDGRPEPREVRNDVRPPRIAIGSSTQYTTPLRTSEGPTRSYSPWTLDTIRRRKSPDRAYEDSRSVAYGSRDISRPTVAPTPFLTKQPLSIRPMKSMPLVAPTLPPMQTSQYPVQHLTVEGFLRSLGLEKYLISLKVEEVDMPALSQMGDRDLKELGIPMGPRKKILLALQARRGRQAR